MTVIQNPTLTCRLAREDDFDLIMQLRIECGWGANVLRQYWEDPNRVYCLFELEGETSSEPNATSPLQKEVVGMGCWVLERDGEPELASRERGIVFIASLFIRQSHQGKGLGVQAMDILERAAVERYNAKWITLDTAAYKTTVKDGITIEHFDTVNPVIAWYEKRGYKHYLENRPLFLHPTPENPNRKLIASFFRKPAELA